MADTKVSALTALSVPVLDDEMYIVDDPAGTPLSRKIALHRLGGLFMPSICQGRLTTESGVPVSTSDRTSQSTLYFAPFNGNRISLHDGTRWKLFAASGTNMASKALSGLTAGRPYDVFGFENAGALDLEFVAWTNDTTRATALALQDGVYVKSGDTTRRYLGMFYTTSTSTTEDSGGGTTTQVGGKRFVWNYCNRVPRPLLVIDTADNWSYATNTTRQANGATGVSNAVEFVIGVNDMLVSADVRSTVYVYGQSATGARVGVGINSASAFSGLRQAGFNAAGSTAGAYQPIGASYVGHPGVGKHTFYWLERGGDGTVIYLGDNGESGGLQSGLSVEVWA